LGPWQREEAVVVLVLLIGGPILAFFAWALVFDFRQRHAPRTGHDIGKAARRARGDAEGRAGGLPPDV
jgi:hypothetical protein